jgi:hypothetical protein
MAMNFQNRCYLVILTRANIKLKQKFMKYVLLVLFLSIGFIAQSQTGSENPCTTFKPATIRAFFDGEVTKQDNTGKHILKASYFHKDIKLSLSDDSYKVLSYTITFDLPDGSLSRLPSEGEFVRIREGQSTEKMKQISPNSTVTIDKIVVVKNGECFKVPAIICFLED